MLKMRTARKLGPSGSTTLIKGFGILYLATVLTSYCQISYFHLSNASIQHNDPIATYLTVETETQKEQGNEKMVMESNEKVSSTHMSTMNPLDGVVELLLPSDKAKAYVSRHPGSSFRFNVQHIPGHLQWKKVSDGVEKFYLRREREKEDMSMQQFRHRYCSWGGNVCNPKISSHSQYSTRRLNNNMDLVLSKLFSEYEGEMQETRFDQSDVFVVPFAMSSFTSAGPSKVRKRQFRDMNELLLDHLESWNQKNETQRGAHLFFQSDNKGLLRSMEIGMLATVEELIPKNSTQKRLVVPFVNTNSEYRPQAVMTRLRDETFFQQKNVSLAAVFSPVISGRSDLRQEFALNATDLFGDNILGLPVVIRLLHKTGRRMRDERGALQLYRDSLFCPVLRGDTPVQKRLFDAILSGCIPAVLAYKWFDKQENATQVSYFSHGLPNYVFLPFAKGAFEGDPDMGIDYQEMVVEVDGSCGLRCMKPTLEKLMKNSEELRRKQQALAWYAPLFSFGMDDGDAFKYPDAVSAMLVQARHHVLAMKDRQFR